MVQYFQGFLGQVHTHCSIPDFIPRAFELYLRIVSE